MFILALYPLKVKKKKKLIVNVLPLFVVVVLYNRNI